MHGSRTWIITNILAATAMAFGTGTLLFVKSFRNFGNGSFTSLIPSEIMSKQEEAAVCFVPPLQTTVKFSVEHILNKKESEHSQINIITGYVKPNGSRFSESSRS